MNEIEIKKPGNPYASLFLIFLLLLAGGSYFYIFNNKNTDTINKDKDDLNSGNLNINVINGYTYHESNDKIAIDIKLPKVDDKYSEINEQINNIKYMYNFKTTEDIDKIKKDLLKQYNDFQVTEGNLYGYVVSYETYKNNNIVSIKIKDSRGIGESGCCAFFDHYVNYDDKTGKIVYLNDYLKLINKTLSRVDNIYKNQINKLGTDDENGEAQYFCSYKPLTEKTEYYIKDNKLYIATDDCSCDYGEAISNEEILIE